MTAALGNHPLPVFRLRATNVTVTYGDNRALDDVSFELNAGQSLALVGANGSGKTTALRLMAGLIAASSGSLEAQPDTQVAYVSQHGDTANWLPLTGLEVIRMGTFGRRSLLGRLRTLDREIIAEAAKRLEVADLLHRQYTELSGGQRQRLRIAQALVQEPNLLLLDEPITGLDLPSQQRILDLVDAETERGTTVVLTTHNLDEARHCADVLLLASTVVAAGRPNEVLTVENLRAAFGTRVLGEHHLHDHSQELLVVDDHGHGH